MSALLVLVTCSWLNLSCLSDKVSPSPIHTNVAFFANSCPNVEINDTTLLKVIRSYIHDLRFTSPSVLILNQGNFNQDSSSYELGHTFYLNYVLERIPDSYAMVDNQLVLIYSGIEYIASHSEAYIDNLKSIVGNRLKLAQQSRESIRKNPNKVLVPIWRHLSWWKIAIYPNGKYKLEMYQ